MLYDILIRSERDKRTEQNKMIRTIYLLLIKSQDG